MYERVALSKQAAAVLRPSAGVFQTALQTRTAVTTAPCLKLFLGIQFFLVACCAAAEIYAKLALHLNGAYTYPLRTRSQDCWDFTLFANKFRHFGQADFFLTDPGIPFAYPAPVAIAYKIFFSYQAHPLRLFLGFALGCFVLAGVLLWRALRRRGLSWMQASAVVAGSLAMAYPLWFELKQGNIEICVWALVAVGVWAFCRGRGYTAAACFGVAGSMKLFPFVYLGLLLSARRYREMAFAAVVACVSTVTSLWLVGPGIWNTWRSVAVELDTFRTIYVLHMRPDEIGFDHSLFGVYKRFWHPLPQPERLGHIVTGYLAVAAVCGVVLYFTKIRRLPLINQVLCLATASILLPPISFDYTLMYLYLPWAMLVLFAQREWQVGRRFEVRKSVPGLVAAMVCFAILMSPESEFIHHGVHSGGQIKALVLVVLLYVGVSFPFVEEEEDGEPAGEFLCGEAFVS